MTNEEFLKVFGEWVESLVEDAKAIEAVYRAEGASREAKLAAVGGLAYLLRKVDIVPDYLGGLGSVDDAMVLRLTAARLVDIGLDGVADEARRRLEALKEDVAVIREFLGDDFPGLERYVAEAAGRKVRGRTPEQVLDDPKLAEQFDYELADEFRAYQPREIPAQEKSLLELRSFIKAKVNKG